MNVSYLDNPLHNAIYNLVAAQSSILDLGCGNGRLLSVLKRQKKCKVIGVEFSIQNVVTCIENDVPILQLNLEDGLNIFDDHTFDIVLQINTLQVLKNTETMLRDTARIGKSAIVAFPNFAWWKNRFSILNGTMPVNKTLPYAWYNTPNIRVGTYADFHVLAKKCHLRVIDSYGLSGTKEIRFLPNIRAETAIFKLSGEP